MKQACDYLINAPDIRDRKVSMICKGECKWLSIRVSISNAGCQHQISPRSQSYPQTKFITANYRLQCWLSQTRKPHDYYIKLVKKTPSRYYTNILWTEARIILNPYVKLVVRYLCLFAWHTCTKIQCVHERDVHEFEYPV